MLYHLKVFSIFVDRCRFHAGTPISSAVVLDQYTKMNTEDCVRSCQARRDKTKPEKNMLIQNCFKNCTTFKMNNNWKFNLPDIINCRKSCLNIKFDEVNGVEVSDILTTTYCRCHLNMKYIDSTRSCFFGKFFKQNAPRHILL